MIELHHLSYRYPTGTEALSDVSAVFPEGKVSAVLGKSGSGKTTLLMLMGRFIAPTAGSIVCQGDPLSEVPEQTWRRRIGIVFQDLYLFPHLTVVDNLILAAVHVQGREKADATTDAEAMLERLGIAELRDSYPAQVSGGQAQRVAIARGLLLRPDYMLLDEPTSALDAATTENFANWLLTLRSETNFIIVTHDLLFARSAASQGIYLSEGQVVADGEIAMLLDRAGER